MKRSGERNPAAATAGPEVTRAPRGWEGAALRAMRARDFTLTVRRTEAITPRLHRLVVADGGLLAHSTPHPTQWVRLWFPGLGRPHQRAYTVVDPDPEGGTFALEIAVHDGPAPAWALAARPGDTIEATVQGSRFTDPGPIPGTAWVIGDLASVPAVRSLVPALLARPDVVPRVRVVLEHAHDDEVAVPLDLPPGVEVARVPRGDGTALVSTALEDLGDPDGDWFWIAAEARSTRALARGLRERGVPKGRIDACGYWTAR